MNALLPESIAPVESEVLAHSAVGASPECGVVNDIRLTVAAEVFEALKSQLAHSNDSETKRNITITGKKIAVKSIEDNGQFFRIKAFGIESPIEVEKNETVTEHLGGGMFNSFVDAGVIVKHLGRKLAPDKELPLTQFAFPAAQGIRETTLEKAQQAGVSNLRMTPVEGETRASLFLKKKAAAEEILLSTPFGVIADFTDLPEFEASTNIVVINNETARSQTFAEIAKHLGRKKKIWAVGSNQIKEGISNYLFFLPHCEIITLNLDELVEWVRSHTDPNIYNDPFLIGLMEDLPPEKAAEIKTQKDFLHEHSQKVQDGLPGHRESFTWNIQADRIPKEISADPDKRFKTAQRCADLIHKLWFLDGTIYVTDGEHNTLVSDRVSRKDKTQSALPILPPKRVQEIKALIEQAGLEAKPDNTGAGDSFAGTVLALKQFTGDKVEPLVIGIMANYVSALIYHTPYSNLLEIEVHHPGLVESVLDLALSKLDRTYHRLKGEIEKPLINPKPARKSPISHMLAPTD